MIWDIIRFYVTDNDSLYYYIYVTELDGDGQNGNYMAALLRALLCSVCAVCGAGNTIYFYYSNQIADRDDTKGTVSLQRIDFSSS